MNCLPFLILFLTSFVCVVVCDYYLGMFQKNDLLVAQDRLYKERVPYRVQYAKYGRVFKCPITYLRVVDRLGYGRGPKSKIIRGGLRRKYVVLRLSAYNSPISVNIYVGCDNKLKYTTTTREKAEEATGEGGDTTAAGGDGVGNESSSDANASGANDSGGASPGGEAGESTTEPPPAE